MAGRCCKVVQLISGIKHMQILHSPQPCMSSIQKSLWSGSVFDSPSKLTQKGNSTNSPDKPKRPGAVFVMYVKEVGDQIRNENPDAIRTEIVALASKMWRELDPEEKSRYAMARRDQYEKFKEEMRKYRENLTPDQIKEEERQRQLRVRKRQKKARQSLGMPKKPLGAFNHFVSEKFGERSGEDVAAYFKALLDQWAKLSESEKMHYREKASEATAKYNAAMAKWESEMIALGRFDVIRKASLKRLKTTDKKSKTKRTKSSRVIQEDEL